MFLPLNIATLGPLPKEEVSAASGFFNLTRQLGGSIGVALLTTLLAKRAAFHRGVLVEKLAAGDAHTVDQVNALTQTFVAHGFDAQGAHDRALGLLDGTVTVQASVLSFADTFWITGALFVVTLPLILLLGKRSSAPVPAGH